MIGDDAKIKVKPASQGFSDIFGAVSYMGNLFAMAELITGLYKAYEKDRPLMNVNPRMYDISKNEINVKAFSHVPVSDHHMILLAVGSPKTGFYQVPIIKLARGVDVMVSGTINEKGEPEKFGETKRLSNLAQEFYSTGLEKVNSTYAVALMPKTDLLGQDVLVAGISKAYCGSSVYHIIVNGFAMERKIVGSNAYGSISPSFVPVMYPQKGGEERFLRVGDILDKRALAKAESQGVFPGLTFVAGYFQEEHHPIVFRSFADEGMLNCSLGAPSAAGPATRGGPGRVGLEVGSESEVKYGKAKGTITGIDGILAMHFIAVEEADKPLEVMKEIDKLM